jgi:hypothetical protein
MSVLKPEGSLTLGVATAAMVFGTYSLSLPSTATVSATAPNDSNLESSRKKAALISSIVVAGVALIARDKTIFVLGGTVLIALDWHARHAIMAHPETGEVVNPTTAYTPASNVTQMPSADAA